MRKNARRLIALLAVAGAAATAACPGPSPANGARPNVLLLVMDTTRADRCSFNGYTRPTTPRLAEFARNAVTFDDCWTPAAWTCPAHASLFTGLRPEHHRLASDGSTALAPEFTTLAEILSAAGWDTATFSNNPYISPEFGLTQGFRTDAELFRGTNRTYPWARETHARALDWMLTRNAEKKPFLAFINDMEPHYPYQPPRDVEARFLRPGVPPTAVESVRALDFPRSIGLCLRTETWVPHEREALSDLYDAEIATLDEEVGRLLDGLRAAQILDNTLVIVMADHGEGLGEHDWIEHGVFMHRELLRVPLIVRFPGRFDGGRRVTDVVRVEDLFPTVLETLELPVPDVDGRSLASDLPGRIAIGFDGAYPTWADKAHGAYPQADVSFLRTGRRSVYDGRHHLIVEDRGGAELYDVGADPGESQNLAGKLADVETRLRGVLRAAHGR